MADRFRRERRRFIQALLRFTLVASVGLMMIGVLIWSASDPRSARAVTPGQLLGSLDTGTRLMFAGMLILAITPALGLVALLVLWVRERAWRFAATAAIVLLLLVAALWAGGG